MLLHILKLQLFNKDQREGLAKVADNLATATIVATVVGGFIDNKIDILKVFYTNNHCNIILNYFLHFQKR